MALLQDIEVEGVTTFTSSPSTSYRYVLQLKNDKMSVWMEDRSSKKQWYKGAMVKADYVTSSNAITDASAIDYLKCFQDVLDFNFNLDGSVDVHRELEIVKGGGARLTFGVTIRVLRSTRVAKFTLDLDPVSVERFDVLESKLRDQEDTIERMDAEIRELKAGRVVPSIQLTASANNSSSNLIWDKPESDDFTVDEDGAVKFHRPGLYSIAELHPF